MKQVMRVAAVLVLAAVLICPISAVQTVIPGGNTIGLHLQTDGVSVVEFYEKAAENAGLERGDLICAVNPAGVSIELPLELAEDLVFAEDHGFESRRDAEKVREGGRSDVDARVPIACNRIA